MAEIDSERVRWLEVSLTLNYELAEAVAEVLSRFVSNGVVVETEMIYNDAEDRGTPSGLAKVFGYLPVDERLEENRQRLEESLWYLGRIQELPEAQYKFIADQDWMLAWKDHYHPTEIGEKLIIMPAWVKDYKTERLVVRIDPSMAFGTGTHPTTQLSMQLIEKYLKSGQNMIDVGCGSGILSIAALHLGATHVLAVDTDYTSVRSTRENAEANHVLENLESGEGSVEDILKDQFSIKKAPVVVANILAPILIRLLDAGLADMVEEDGVLLLSGILDEQIDKMKEAASRQNLVMLEFLQERDWVALAFKRNI